MVIGTLEALLAVDPGWLFEVRGAALELNMKFGFE